jgi:hypothetical protein
MPQTFGISTETESSWPNNMLSEAHARYIADYVQQIQAREEAFINRWLESARL